MTQSLELKSAPDSGPAAIPELQRHNWALEAYAAAASALIHTADPEEVYLPVCKAIVARDHFAAAGILLMDEDGLLRPVASAGPACGYYDGLVLSRDAAAPLGGGPGGQAIRSGRPTLMRDSRIDDRFAPWRDKAAQFGLRSTISVPFLLAGEPRGLLSVYADIPDAFGPDEMAIFSRLAEEVAFAVTLREDRRRLAEAQTERESSEARYRLLFDHAASGIAFADPNGYLLDASPALCRMLGRPAEELIGLRADDLVAETSRAIFLQGREDLQRGQRVGTLRRFMFRRKDGSTFPADLSVSVLPDKTRLAIVRDLSEVAKAEAALSHIEDRYETVFEHASGGLVIGDTEGTYIEVNPAFCRMLGYSREELIGQSAALILGPEELDLLPQTRATFAATGTYTAPRRWTFRRKDGTTFPAEFSVSLLPDGNRLSVVRDVSEVAKAEAALAASEAQFRSLFQHAPAGIIVLSPEGVYLDINPAACTMLGATRETFVGLRTDAILEPDTQALVDKAADEIEAHGTFHSTWRLRRFDGGFVSAEVVSTLLPSGDYVSILVDVTERERAEAARRESEGRYNSLFEYAPVAVILHRDMAMRDINPTGCAMLGYDREDFIGLPIEKVLSPEDYAIIDDGRREVLERGVYRRRLRVRRKDGELIPAEGVSTLMPDGGFVTLLIDLTDRERAEEAMREARAHLERLGRTAALGEMISILAHEVNQPLAAIAANGQAARRWLDRDPPDLAEAQDAMASILRDVDRAAQVIRRTRATLQGRPADFALFDLNALLEEAGRLLGAEKRRAGVAAVYRLEPELPPIWGDPIQILQVVVNLALNAIQAMAEDSEPPRLLTLTTKRVGETVEVSVEDTGPGLPPETNERLFERFFTTRSEGTGIGLAVVRTLVEAHGGEVRAENAPVRGARFVFTLPIPSGASS